MALEAVEQGNGRLRRVTGRCIVRNGKVFDLTRLSAFSVERKPQQSTQKMSSWAMKSSASSIGRTVRPKGLAAVHRSFQADQ
jgi:hypothetical protein